MASISKRKSGYQAEVRRKGFPPQFLSALTLAEMQRPAVKKSFVRAVQRANPGDLHFHDLRHEATSRMAGKLDNVLELSAVTGHKSLAMLKRYYHPRASEIARELG